MKTIIRHTDDKSKAEVTCHVCGQTQTTGYFTAKRAQHKPCFTCINKELAKARQQKVVDYVAAHNSKDNGLYITKFVDGHKTCEVLCKHCGSKSIVQYRPYLFTRYGCKACTDSIRGNKTQKYKDLGITNKHRLYHIFNNMLNRTGEYRKGNDYYTTTNIKVCDEWAQDRRKFFEWSLANGYASNLTIDRINNSKGYSPDNCRWVAQTIQQRNTRLLRSSNTSGYRGVSFTSHDKTTYRARVKVRGIEVQIHTADSAKECAYFYDKYIRDHNLEHTRNFTDDEYTALREELINKLL